MGTAIAVPLEEYLDTSYRPDCEWVDGEVKERNVGEGSHAMIQQFLSLYFGIRAEEWNVRVVPEQRVQTSSTHFRVPDICLMRRDAPFEEIVRTPPLLCVEILSRKDTMSEMYERVEDYLGMGVGTVWIIDPRRRKLFCSDARWAMLPVEETLVVAGSPILVTATDLFRQLDELQGRS